MRVLAALPFLLLPLCAWGDAFDKPAKITVHTWVREDLFAALMVDDSEALERGARKLDRILAVNPDDEVAISWRVLEYVTRSAFAEAKGDRAASKQMLERALALRERIASSRDQGVNTVLGGSLLLYCAKSPANATEMLYRDGRDHLLKVRKAQEPVLAKLPPHFSGELLSQIVFASDRLGDQESKERYLAEMKKLLPGTPYERRAGKWQTSEIKDWNAARCISCHEPGRLENVVAAATKQ